MPSKRPTQSKQAGYEGAEVPAWIAEWVKNSTTAEKGGIIYPSVLLAPSWGEVDFAGSPKVGPRTKVGSPCRDYTVLDFEGRVWQKGCHEAEGYLSGGVGESSLGAKVIVLELL